jgi:hypothetical protein
MVILFSEGLVAFLNLLEFEVLVFRKYTLLPNASSRLFCKIADYFPCRSQRAKIVTENEKGSGWRHGSSSKALQGFQPNPSTAKNTNK